MSGTDKNTGVGPLSPSVHRQFEEEDIGGEGGTASRNGLQKTLPKPRSLALSSSGKLESLPMLLITANVGSMFDDPQHLIPQWLSQVCKQIQAQKPAFVAIHCQEVGGKNFEQSMENVDEFVGQLRARLSELGFRRTVAFLDENFTASEKFTALGSLYFLHDSAVNVQIYDFQKRSFSRVSESILHLGTIDEVPCVEKHKFPLQYFPESRWSRKGYLRTRWKFSTAVIVDLVNIHLFHDSSNLKSVESVPSIYVNYRKRALCYTLDRIAESKGPANPPYFIFGDFNFRLDCKSVVKSLTSDLLDITHPEAQDNKQYVDKRSQELVLSIGKKEFALLHADNTFRGQWRKWRPYDMEVGELRDRLTEFPLAFPPTYPFAEDPNTGTSYMRTRCPAWCDRVLMSHEARSLLVKADQADPSFHYDVIGKDVCMGDHKPVFLWCRIGLTAPAEGASSPLPHACPTTRGQQQLPHPRVESPSYTDLLNSPPASNGGCLRFTDIKDPSTVKLFKETTV